MKGSMLKELGAHGRIGIEGSSEGLLNLGWKDKTAGTRVRRRT